MKKVLLVLITIISSCYSKTEIQVVSSMPKRKIEKKYTKDISDPNNKLTSKIEDLEIEYVVFGCACPNWIRTKDNIDTDTTKKLNELYFYIEPAEKNLELPIYFNAFRHILKISGKFYEKEDYLKGTIEMEEPMPKGRVFRYNKIQVVEKPNFRPETQIITMILNYNAISCTCAQWSEIKYSNDNDHKIYYWLEPENEKLIQADTLFNGTDLPVQIKVTGQIVSENGFPTQKNLVKVRQQEAGKVFRYSKIEIIDN